MSRKENLNPLPINERPEIWLPKGHVLKTCFWALRKMTYEAQENIKKPEWFRVSLFLKTSLAPENRLYLLAAIQLFPVFGLSGHEEVISSGNTKMSIRELVDRVITIFQRYEKIWEVYWRNSFETREPFEDVKERIREELRPSMDMLPNVICRATGENIKEILLDHLSLDPKKTLIQKIRCRFSKN